MANPRIIQDARWGTSLLVVDFDKEAPFVVNSGVALTDGSAHVTRTGWKRYATITYHWANSHERDHITDLPDVGLDTLIPAEAGWSYDEPSQTQIAPTIHVYDIVVKATWHGATRPTD